MEDFLGLGFLLVLVGLALIIISSSSGSIEAGGVVFIGPVPLPFGSKRIWLPLAIAGTVIITVFYLVSSGST